MLCVAASLSAALHVEAHVLHEAREVELLEHRAVVTGQQQGRPPQLVDGLDQLCPDGVLEEHSDLVVAVLVQLLETVRP